MMARSEAVSPVLAGKSGTPCGTASALPVERLSTTTTGSPASRSASTTWLPM
jgi:hypothetical protein